MAASLPRILHSHFNFGKEAKVAGTSSGADKWILARPTSRLLSDGCWVGSSRGSPSHGGSGPAYLPVLERWQLGREQAWFSFLRWIGAGLPWWIGPGLPPSA
ncbi:hypothetical protein H920_16029 [Fukomys damarensis]|uniref:Uncharacterized protein n=1 Tax=Fukomys damarensis TaxID=885580 RepID=A0A091CT58_FUKDA|nr:hypothetical protein H920_16029 [Fukomys damarensis]